MPDRRARRPLTALGALTTLAGLLLFAWWIRRTGLDEIRAGFAQVGWRGLAVIVALGGLRFAVRAGAWKLCLEPPHHLSFFTAFRAVVAGDALGNLLPLGPLISEPTKVAFVRGHVALAPAVTALAVENVVYTLSVAAMIAGGLGALLFVFELPPQLRGASQVALALLVILFLAALLLAWSRPAVLSRLGALLPGRLTGPLRLRLIRTLEHQIYTFGSRRAATILPLLAAELLFHVLGVLEAYITLWLLLGTPAPLIYAFVVETANRLITVMFKFVPMGLGVNEALTALLAGVLGLGTGAGTGTTIGLVRKVRLLCWTAVGTVLLIRRGLSAARILADPHVSTEST